MSVSGRAGLFTIKSFNPNLTDQVEATSRGQKSGALRMEFGKIDVTTAATTASVNVSIMTGIMALVTPTKVPTLLGTSGGIFMVATSGSFLSGVLNIDIVATGAYSGMNSGMAINYMVIGY